MKQQLKLATMLVWMILSVLVIIILITPFFVPYDLLKEELPQCDWKAKYNKACLLCGMTTAFFSISRGQFAQAYHLNTLSLYLYAMFVVNVIFFATVLFRKNVWYMMRH